MTTVDVWEASSLLSTLVDSLERGREKEIVIARDGRPAARLVPIEAPPKSIRLGAGRGRFEIPDSIDVENESIAALFGSEGR